MTDTPISTPPTPIPTPPIPLRRGLRSRLWSSAQLLVAVAATTAFLVKLISTTPGASDALAPPESRPAEVVEVVGPGLIRVVPGGPFDTKVQTATVRSEVISDPVLSVSGRVAASLRPGTVKGNDFWQFDSAEVLTSYTDWQKAQADITFAETQLVSIKQLATARLETSRQVVARLEKLVSAGTDTLKDLAAEKANLIQAEILGRKETYEAETAVRVSKRAEAAAAKQLQQAGLDTEILKAATSDIDIVLADVPEGRLDRVKIGQGCRARFFGLPAETFVGKVSTIAPVLSKERRSLRVLFAIDDLKDQLRPGMFAEIGLGTDPRETTLIPADSILHIGRADYVLVAAGENTWKVVEVTVGEPRTGDIQILTGVVAGQRIVAKGSILFKPLVVKALSNKPEAPR